MLTEEQINTIALLSDEVLYREAVAFMRQLLEEEDCEPLPMSQIQGLHAISLSLSYQELRRFVAHQNERNWPRDKENIKVFYKKLKEYMESMQKKRLKNEFHLLSDQGGPRQVIAQTEELMALLMAEFIQHLAAENSYLLAVQKQQSRQKKASSSRSK
ncbi:hypothetical protein [Thermogemmatispora tikiterensis]|uniref:Uncharacterized protein n=1 Tax=Thermogemmatispora tikiterensis TaxID=1825093 RepID=A0A328VIR1_9CHLR|nr:hypothetical protein [Thermogemmatispora tikiterensis]RAQ96012.1 hypothetical protein A4R35_10745 [Thermogemmatispora tikiterensis]